ncbi:MAG TPA: PhzF family phenazine biosynthesis protein [Thermoleophilaceae bacterium]|nr:PhzF family phenazine biosynthesis protein [Thermoleophilaceae bacterium]
MPQYQLLNVFTAEDGSHGNPLGVFLDGSVVPTAEERQRVAADLGYSETVFIDDLDAGQLRIFTPETELPLAGHPLVGSAWLIARERGACEVLRPPAGEVATWEEEGLRWIRARPEWGPPFQLQQYDGADQIDALDGVPDGLGLADCWAWIDEQAGVVRSRVFVPEAGVEEDEATGSAALRLAAFLGRPIEIRQGTGSVLRARPGPDGTAEVGGGVRDFGTQMYGD